MYGGGAGSHGETHFWKRKLENMVSMCEGCRYEYRIRE